MPRRVAVAYSGGRDSTALLHATAVAAKALGIAVHALHVHHGLSRHADAWLAHCKAQCHAWRQRGLEIEFHNAWVEVPRTAAGIEAEARARRYGALAVLARRAGCDRVLLAHHLEDQAETFLLQALRGAGVAGLAAMPAAALRDGVLWLRPWLARPRSSIEAYLRRHRLAYIDDDSNAQARFARNRLRLAVWPALQSAFPDAAQRFAQAARWQGEALEGLAALAAQDIAAVSAGGAGLSQAALLALEPARGRNALRHWLAAQLGQMPGAGEFDDLWQALPGSAPARWPLAHGGELRRYRGRLLVSDKAPDTVARAAGEKVSLQIRKSGRYPLPAWGGALQVKRVTQGGVALSMLADVQCLPREGGERFQRAPGTPPRALKKQYQLAGVPAWARQGPLLWSGERLVFVPGLGLDARVLAAHGEVQVSLSWVALPAAG